MKTERIQCDGVMSLSNQKDDGYRVEGSPLAAAWAYRNGNVISKFARDTGIEEERAEQLFEDMKGFLIRAACATSPLEPPSREVDAMWHSFILFTSDYATFCQELGRFVHHVPHVLADACTADQGGSQDNGGMRCHSVASAHSIGGLPADVELIHAF